MAKAEWGSKRQCPNCGARFYDLGNVDPISCIACAQQFTPEVLLKPRRGRPDDKIAAIIDPVAAVAAGDDEDSEAEEDGVTVSLDQLAAEEAEDEDEDAVVIAIIPDIDEVDEDLLADGDESNKGLLETDDDDDDDDILPTPAIDE